MKHTYKIYLKDNKECFQMELKEVSEEKDFDFSQSLLDFLDLDLNELSSVFDDMRINLRNIIEKKEVEQNCNVFIEKLKSISEKHIYFQFLYLDWNCRMDSFIKGNYKNANDIIEIKKFSHILVNLIELQLEVSQLLTSVLDVLSSENNLQTKLVNLMDKKDDDFNRLKIFKFGEQTTKFEKVDKNTFTEVLHPKDIYDIIEFFVRNCIKKEQLFKKCKSCGRYFAIYGWANSEYCNRKYKETGKTCKEVGAVKFYQSKIKEQDDPVLKAFNKAYKTRYARIKYGKISKEEFNIWADVARSYRDECIDGKTSLASFEQWLRDS